MSAHRKVDPSTLGWVKSEIDETLKQARLALEGFVENPTDRSGLRFCITHLHQVVGTLLMVELDGAAMMAREIEALAEAVLDEKAKATPEVLESLTRGILVLPDYLARLQYGHPDVPLKHLALLNELRAARAAAAIGDLDLFEPDLSVRPPSGSAERLSDAEFAAAARQLRATYQSSLLTWLRDPSDKAGLRAIAGVLEELQARAGMGVLEQLFWIAGGLLEGMIDGGLDGTPEIKKHLARLDQQIKKIVDGTEKSVLRSSSEAVVRAMLYEIARVRCTTPKIVQLKQLFRLDELIGAGAEAAGDDGETKPSPQVLQSVASVLAREIEQAQDLLASAFESHKTDSASLAPLLELLRRMAGTVDMAGVPSLKNLIDALIAACVALGEGRIGNVDGAAMPMAQALLTIEGGAREIHRSADEWKQQVDQAIRTLQSLQAAEKLSVDGIEVSDAALTETEYQQLLGVVAGEVGVNLGKIEEALEGFATHGSQLERLDDIPKQLEQIQGAMHILGAEPAVELASVTRRYIDDLRSGRLGPDPTVLDGLAVCIGTLGAYVDGLKAGRKNINSLVEAALRELQVAVKDKPAADNRDPIARLRGRLDAWFANPSDADARAALQQQLQLASTAPSREPEKTRLIATEMGRLLDLVGEDAGALSAEVRDTLRASCDALAGQRLPPPAPAAPPRESKPAAPLAPLADNFDQEILEIFIEDARDVYGNIAREFSNWRVDTGNQAALLELRRGYHTLKGSGRMVGANQIAELAWSVENMLNHVRDGKIKATPEVIDIVAESQAYLPDMIAQLEGGPAPAGDPAGLAARAHDVVARRGEAPRAPKAPPPELLPKLDGPLLEIFTNEARGHLVNIGVEIGKCRAAGSTCLVSSSLTRSIHTLQGNARSLGIPMMADACAEMEKLLHALDAQHLPLVREHLDMLEKFAATVTDLVSAIASGVTASGDLPRRFADMTARLHAEHERFVAPSPAHAPPPRPLMRDLDVADAEESLIGPRFADPSPRASSRASLAASTSSDELDSGGEPVIDHELLEIFQEEATDILNQMEEALRSWRAEPANMGFVPELKRGLHTLKGGARMAGAMPMGNLSHQTESLLMQVESHAVAPSAQLFELLVETHDTLVSMLNDLTRGSPLPATDALLARLGAATGGQVTAPAMSDAPFRAVERETPMPSFESTKRTPGAPKADSPPKLVEIGGRATDAVEMRAGDKSGADPESWVDRRERPGQIRVNTDLLNNLVNYAGEVSISRSRMEQQIYGFRDNLSELRRSAVRFREQLRELEIQSESQILYRLDHGADGATDFDPLEFDRFSRLQQLARSLTESLHDLTTIQLNMGNFVGEAEAVLQQQARLNTELQEGLMRTRMVEFSTQAARLRHITRQTARELGKRAELEFAGGDVQIDRTVLERMIGPFEHMIRNSIDHGIEPEAERTRAGKPPVGRITVAAQQEGNEIVIRFSDDGAGMNVDRIREKAVERGLLSAETHVSEDDLLQFVLISGFSTALEVTHVSGRGVGMDVVHSEVKQLGGSMAVNTKRGEGTTFIIRLPLTLSITQALMVYVGEQPFAVPLGSVANIIECTAEELSRMAVGKNPLLNHADKLYSFMNLSARLGITSSKTNGRKVPVLLARAGAREVAIQVDGLGGTREIVIKALGSQLAEIKGLGGATIMGDGRVVLILDVPGLWYAEETLRVDHQPRPRAQPAAEVRARPVIMVVDDSLTVRKVTGKHLQKRGFDVMVAKDGIDAVEQLRARVPDLMLVDIEMPRMDGYELTGRVRSESNLKHIPIIIITSRAGEKHRTRAFELGVDSYMSKPYQEEELFKNIDNLLAHGRPH